MIERSIFIYDADIQSKVSMLPESAKQEALDFVEFLLSKYGSFSKKQTRKGKNPMSEIAGFAEIGKMDSAEIDSEITPYQRVRPLSELWKVVSATLVRTTENIVVLKMFLRIFEVK